MIIRWHFLKIFLLFLTIYLSYCAETKAEETPADYLPKTIVELKHYYKAVVSLEKRGILNDKTAAKEKKLCLEHATKLTGQTDLLTADEFLTWERRQTVISFSNVIAIIAGIVVMIAATVLVSLFLLPLLIYVPNSVWETIFYVISFIMMLLNSYSWVIFFGCLVFLGSVCFTFQLHFKTADNQGLSMSWICCLTWTSVALYQQNQEAAYLAVIALESALGFVLFAGPLFVAIGFEEEKLIPSGTASSFILAMLGILLHLCEKMTPLTVPFTRPLIFLGTCVYFIGMLILSSQVYHTRSHRNDLFWILQIVSFVSGLAAIFFGPLLGIPFIQGIGGTMFVFWLLEKYVELIEWKDNIRVALNLLGFGILLYLFASFLRMKPEYFIFHSAKV